MPKQPTTLHLEGKIAKIPLLANFVVRGMSAKDTWKHLIENPLVVISSSSDASNPSKTSNGFSMDTFISHYIQCQV